MEHKEIQDEYKGVVFFASAHEIGVPDGHGKYVGGHFYADFSIAGPSGFPETIKMDKQEKHKPKLFLTLDAALDAAIQGAKNRIDELTAARAAQ